MRKLGAALAVIMLLVFGSEAEAQRTPVDLELSLVIDVSGSVSGSEYNTMMNGYASAFEDRGLQDAILQGATGKIVVNVVFFSDLVVQGIPFILIDSHTTANQFAGRLRTVDRPFVGGTRVDRGIDLAVSNLMRNDFTGTRTVIDVSGDGDGDNRSATARARDNALTNGVDAINGLVIGSSVGNFYRSDVIGGGESFVEVAANWQDFADAIRRKLRREVIVAPPDPEVIVSKSTVAVAEAGGPDNFGVTLTSAPSGTVTVTAGSNNPDVTVSPARLTFTASNWNVAQTVTVRAAADADAEDDTATLTLQARGGGYDGQQASLSVSVTDDDDVSEAVEKAVEEVVVSATSAVASNVTANIGTRFSAARTGGTSVVVGGVSLAGTASSDVWSDTWGEGDDAFRQGERAEESHTGYVWSPSASDLLRSSSFAVALNASDSEAQGVGGSAGWTFWGQGDLMFFQDDPDAGESFDGDLRAGYLGVDARFGERWVGGAAVSHTRVEADYDPGDGTETGRLELILTGIHPYAHVSVGERTELWTVLGAGRGEVEHERAGGVRETSEATMRMGAGGMRRALETSGAVGVALLGDVGFSRVETDEVGDEAKEVIDNLSVHARRVRLGVEGSYTAQLAGGASLTSLVELAGRYDLGGDDEEYGLETSGGLSYWHGSGFGLDARARLLAMYTNADYREWGVSMTARVSPGSGGEGLSLSLTPRWGAPVQGAGISGVGTPMGGHVTPNALSRRQSLLSAGVGEPSLDARLAYGLRVRGATVTPFGDASMRGHGVRRLGLGLRVAPRGSAPEALTWEVVGGRYESHTVDPEHHVALRVRMQF